MGLRCAPCKVGSVRVPFARPLARSLSFFFFFSQQYKWPLLVGTGDGKGGDTQLQLLGSFTDLAAFRLAGPFLLVGLSVPIGGSRFQASLALTWEIKELTSSFLEPEVSNQSTSFFLFSEAFVMVCWIISRLLSCFSGEEGWWSMLACSGRTI